MLVAFIAIGVGATIAVVYVLIDTLNKNSQTLRKYEVKPADDIKISEVASVSDYLHDHPKAYSHYREAIAIESHDVQKALALYKQCQKELEQDQPEEGDNFLKGMHYMCMGRCYLRLKDYSNALKCANSAIDSDKAPMFFSFRADVYDALGKPDPAAKDRQEAQRQENTHSNPEPAVPNF